MALNQVSPGNKLPDLFNVIIEIPAESDPIKYEVDKSTGYMRVDRPQRSSSMPPALYGFIPRTYCDEHVARLSAGAERGDGDPLDICVISERPINRAEVILNARVVGGLDVNDHGEADDKIIAVLDNDLVYRHVQDVADLPPVLVERLSHYFATYKLIPGEESKLKVERIYGAEHAQAVVQAALQDYTDEYGQ